MLVFLLLNSVGIFVLLLGVCVLMLDLYMSQCGGSVLMCWGVYVNVYICIDGFVCALMPC